MTGEFIWIAPTSGAPVVTIASYGLTFNPAAVEMLGKPRFIMIGFDEASKAVAVKPIDSEGENPRYFPFAGRERQGYVRIGVRDFIRYLAQRTGYDYLTRSARYGLAWDRERDIVLADLTSPLDYISDGPEEDSVDESDDPEGR